MLLLHRVLRNVPDTTRSAAACAHVHVQLVDHNYIMCLWHVHMNHTHVHAHVNVHVHVHVHVHVPCACACALLSFSTLASSPQIFEVAVRDTDDGHHRHRHGRAGHLACLVYWC